MEEFFELNKLTTNNFQIPVVQNRDQLWKALESGNMVTCQDAGTTFFNDLFADEADVVMSNAPTPHGDVELCVLRSPGNVVMINQKSRFPLEGFSWKRKEP